MPAFGGGNEVGRRRIPFRDGRPTEHRLHYKLHLPTKTAMNDVDWHELCQVHSVQSRVLLSRHHRSTRRNRIENRFGWSLGKMSGGREGRLFLEWSLVERNADSASPGRR